MMVLFTKHLFNMEKAAERARTTGFFNITDEVEGEDEEFPHQDRLRVALITTVIE